MEHLDLPAHRIPFELLDGVFARLDRQVGEELPFDFLPILRRLLFLGMDDCQSQSWVSLLLANGRKDPNPAISDFENGLFQITLGILMHSSLAITTAGLPLGLCAVKFWTRDKFKGTAALKRKINPTRVPIEKKESIRWLENLKQSTELLDDPGRCIHIGDRESDIYELFCTAQEVGTHFLVRTCVDRLAGDGDHTVADEMDVTSVKGLHRIEVRDDVRSRSVKPMEHPPSRIRCSATNHKGFFRFKFSSPEVPRKRIRNCG